MNIKIFCVYLCVCVRVRACARVCTTNVACDSAGMSGFLLGYNLTSFFHELEENPY